MDISQELKDSWQIKIIDEPIEWLPLNQKDIVENAAALFDLSVTFDDRGNYTFTEAPKVEPSANISPIQAYIAYLERRKFIDEALNIINYSGKRRY